jgi:hypothetical protein
MPVPAKSISKTESNFFSPTQKTTIKSNNRTNAGLLVHNTQKKNEIAPFFVKNTQKTVVRSNSVCYDILKSCPGINLDRSRTFVHFFHFDTSKYYFRGVIFCGELTFVYCVFLRPKLMPVGVSGKYGRGSFLLPFSFITV